MGGTHHTFFYEHIWYSMEENIISNRNRKVLHWEKKIHYKPRKRVFPTSLSTETLQMGATDPARVYTEDLRRTSTKFGSTQTSWKTPRTIENALLKWEGDGCRVLIPILCDSDMPQRPAADASQRKHQGQPSNPRKMTANLQIHDHMEIKLHGQVGGFTLGNDSFGGASTTSPNLTCSLSGNSEPSLLLVLFFFIFLALRYLIDMIKDNII